MTRFAWFFLLAACNTAGPTLNNQQNVAACLTLVGCDLHIPTPTVEGCVTLLDRPSEQQLPLSPTQIACLAAARSDCAAASACISDGKTACPAVTACEGNLLKACYGGSFAYELDCTLVGQICVGHGCGDGPCLRDDRGDSSFCDGNKVSTCLSQAEHSTDCAALGSTCVDDGFQGKCTGDCSGITPRCDGNTYVYCYAGKEQRRDCAALGLACIPSRVAGLDDPCAAADQCPQPFQDSCNGTQLTFCNEGKRTTLDCVAQGFRGCQVDSTFGRCTP